MPAIDEYIKELIKQKNALISVLKDKGVDVKSDEKFNTLVEKVNDISSGGGDTVGTVDDIKLSPMLYLGDNSVGICGTYTEKEIIKLD